MSIKKETWFNLLAAWLILMAAWTVFIKFLFPIVYAVNYGHDFLNYIMWDFWWVAHIWLAYSFLNISRYTFYFWFRNIYCGANYYNIKIVFIF